jgi:quinol monooxygenase YgiN
MTDGDIMSQVVAIVKMPAAPGKGKELAEAMNFALENVKSEAGTRYYIIHADVADSDVLWMYEMYETQADMDPHMGSDWFKQLGPMIGGLFGGAPEFHVMTPLGGKGF